MTTGIQFGRPIEILLVEDNPGDVRLTREGLKETKIDIRLSVVSDVDMGLRFLRREGEYAKAARPDTILLDLNLPGRNGHELLAELRSDPLFEQIPVIVLSTSDNDEDIQQSYRLKANCYLTKPVDFDEFTRIVRDLERFWFSIVHLPSQPGDGRSVPSPKSSRPSGKRVG